MYISNDLKWNQHDGYIVRRANKRLYALRLFKKSGLHHTDLAQLFMSTEVGNANAVEKEMFREREERAETSPAALIKLAFPISRSNKVVI